MRVALIFLPFVVGLLGAAEKSSVIVVTGASGTEEYGQDFAKWADRWKAASKKAKATFRQVGKAKKADPKDNLRKILAKESKKSPQPLWIVLLGHGTYAGKQAKFNLNGPDLEAGELAEWLKDFERPLVIVNCASSSSPFHNSLRAKGRVVITATRSGVERNYCRLGGFLATAIGDSTADLDKDGQTSLLEAWLIAARRTAAFYEEEGRLATEHSLLDDNGDGKGTQSDWFRGLQVTSNSAEEGLLPDGLRAHQIHLVPSANERKLTAGQRAERDALELELARHRSRKTKLKDLEYYDRLEEILSKMSRIYFP
ncbi:MAG: hypothetical protein CMI26_00535 [Opitutae bacterium]|jgi:hypothetical protein|nr:hypothetical protein [Opitutae bacterium]|tara:strand:- start:1889 stop:2827 length:939 start_codon:yes stop_codon:yes gene_type:complete